jgi:TfoX/Sxy family transcriptional regulator of competence genes
MGTPKLAPSAHYASLAVSFAGHPRVTRVTEGGGFGSAGQLKVNGRIFAMLVRGRLVVKLPRGRVDELVESGEGERFDAGKGKPMREWFVLSPTSKKQWQALTNEALEFVGAN